MGLPMYRDIAEADGHDAAAKPDRAAAARRSTIRRETTVRPNRSPRIQASTSPSSRDELRDRLIRRRRLSLERDQRQIEHLEAELERLRLIRMQSRARLELEHESHGPVARIRGEWDRLRTEDAALDTDLQELGASDVFPPDVMRPHLSRLSNHSAEQFIERVTSRGFTSHDSSSPRRYRYGTRLSMPSPPYSLENDRGSTERPARPVVDGPVDLTPNFPPAHRLNDRRPQSSEARVRAFVDEFEQPSAMGTPPPEDWEGLYPLLRRVGRLSPRPRSHRPHYDGLGDRRRSVSPSFSDLHEEETWETLMNTMDDDRRPSAQSSFASNARSDSATRSNRSSQTAATSFGEIGQLDDACLDLPYGITEEDARELRLRHEHNALSRSGNLNVAPPVIMAIETSDNSRHNRAVIERRTPEIRMFENILGRMQRREEIPVEWWEALGLSPAVWDMATMREGREGREARQSGTSAPSEQREESRANA